MYLVLPWSIILTVKQNVCVKHKKKIIREPVPGNQIVVSVKIKFKIATVDRFSLRFTNNKEKTVLLVSITRQKGISTRRFR